MRRLLVCVAAFIAASLAASGVSMAAGPLRVKLSASQDLTRVTYSVTASQPVRAGKWVLFGSNTVSPTTGELVVRTPKLNMNGLPKPVSVMGKYFKVKLPALKPGQTVRFYATFRKEDVAPRVTCHLIFQVDNPKNFDRACNVKV